MKYKREYLYHFPFGKGKKILSFYDSCVLSQPGKGFFGHDFLADAEENSEGCGCRGDIGNWFCVINSHNTKEFRKNQCQRNQ